MINKDNKIIIFGHKYIFILSILILGIIICIEANNIFSKLLFSDIKKKKFYLNKFNSKFIVFNILAFTTVSKVDVKQNKQGKITFIIDNNLS